MALLLVPGHVLSSMNRNLQPGHICSQKKKNSDIDFQINRLHVFAGSKDLDDKIGALNQGWS